MQRRTSKKQKALFTENIRKAVDNINPYLASGESETILYRRTKPLSTLPEVTYGSMANDGGHLIFTDEEYNQVIRDFPSSKKYFKKFIGAEEYLNNTYRWVLWIEDEDKNEAYKIKPIAERVGAVKKIRLESSRKATKKLANKPHRFGEVRYTGKDSIIIPKLSSEGRSYIPMGYIEGSQVISDRAFMIQDAPLWLFSLLSSKIHMVWVNAVAGRLEMRINYSTTIIYNNFPIHTLSQHEMENLSKHGRKILLSRATHPEMTIADMYKTNRMPTDLKAAHDENDNAVDQIYRKGGFKNDEERLATLFDLYEKMTEKEEEK